MTTASFEGVNNANNTLSMTKTAALRADVKSNKVLMKLTNSGGSLGMTTHSAIMR